MSKIYSTGNEENQSGNQEKPTKSSRIPLAELSQRNIMEIFDNLNQEGRQILIPIGFPKAGKSLFLSSLLYYSQRYTDKKWTAMDLTEYPYDKGNISRDTMVKYFDDKEAYPSTEIGTLDLIGIDMEPNKKGLPILKLAFVDLAGEDLQEIKSDNKGKFNPKIEGILKACELGKPIFCLITPYKPVKGDKVEDTLHQNFINYIKVNMPDLYNVSKFIVIVSQWDKIPVNENLEVEKYIKQFRPSLDNAIKSRNAKIVYGEFSVGKVVDTFDDKNDPVVFIQRLDFHYPHNFWNNLYKLATGKSFEGQGLFRFFKKLFE
ncbi:MAG TPA: hypothetical protein VK169_08775 [Saprospiraceae bacterium]|nr:hypothetical protein [Saprospiraceae bacterium]